MTAQNIVKTPVFLLGTGRSGTTLVQRLLNSYPDTMIWGEHAGFLKDLARSYKVVAKHPSMHEYSYSMNSEDGSSLTIDEYKDPARWQAWNNWFSVSDIKQSYRKMLEGVFNPGSIGPFNVWGFKEIRYGHEDDVLAFLLELYPESRFVIVVRNGLNTIESQLNTFHQGESKYLTIKRLLQLPIAIRIAWSWSRQNTFFKQFADANPTQVCLVRYEDLLSSEQDLKQIFAFLGKEFGDEQREIMTMKEGRGTSYSGDLDENDRWHRLGLIPGLILRLITKSTSRLYGY